MSIYLTPEGTEIAHCECAQVGDLEILQTNYSHPTITEGMHTNGPAATWVRTVGGKWICVGRMSRHTVRQYWTVFGEGWLASL